MVKVFAKSDIGQRREKNEDSFYIPEEDDELKLYILADGMGGYNGGDIASKLAIKSAKNYLTNNFKSIPHDSKNIEKLINSSMEYANMIVYEKSKEDKNLEGMGTTLEMCLVYGNHIHIGHIGDSRIYRIRKNIIRQLTTDDSYVEKLVKEGKITEEEAKHHPRKNMLMKALGCMPFVEPTVMTKGFLKGDAIVLTSDGLTNMVEKKEIYEIVTKELDVSAEKLVKLANQRGGYDNITIIIAYDDIKNR